MTDMKPIEDIVRDFIIKEFMVDRSGATVDENDLLIRAGIIDSLGIFILISFIEKKFNIKLAPQDVVIENFQTINAISKLVRSKIS